MLLVLTVPRYFWNLRRYKVTIYYLNKVMKVPIKCQLQESQGAKKTLKYFGLS